MDRTSFYKQLGERVRYLRLEKKMTLEQLGSFPDIELSRTTVSNIELGRQQLSAFQLAAFAKALDTSIEDLIGAIATSSPVTTNASVSASLKDFINDL